MFERASLLTMLIGATLSCACTNPDGAYQDFKDRYAKTTPAGGPGCGTDPGACTAPPVGEMDGQWLLALSVTLAPAVPLLFFDDVTTTDNAGATSMAWSLTPLDAKARTPLPPPDGTPIPLPASDIPADGNWTAPQITVALTGKANPITAGDISADVILAGSICGGRTFLCGTVTGNVTKPVPLDLKGSTWTLEKLPAPDTLPKDIKIDCECKLAGPAPQ